MGSAIFHLVILLLSIFPAFARSSVCSIGSLRVDPNGVVSTSYFTVKIKCSSKNVEINWRKITGENRDEEYYEEYFSAVSFLMCKDTSGNEVYQGPIDKYPNQTFNCQLNFVADY